MLPAFASTRRTVAIPFRSRIVSTIPREHKLVVNGSFGDRYVEGTMIYLHADPHTPSINMYDSISKREIVVQDFTSYPSEYPFRGPSCLLRFSPSLLKEMTSMHTEDDSDDLRIAAEIAAALTRSKAHANAAALALDSTLTKGTAVVPPAPHCSLSMCLRLSLRPSKHLP